MRLTDHRVPILVNEYEWVVDGQLGRLCETYDARLFEKVGVKDVLPIRDGKLSRADRDYGFMAHFDFVITDQDSEALIAVEFDGPRHLTDPQQIIRDDRKNRICHEFMLPLVRVGAPALLKADHRTLLEWLMEVFFEERLLWKEQEAYNEGDGEEPAIHPEDLNYRDYFKHAKRGLHVWGPLDPFGEARATIGEHYWGQAGGHPRYEGWWGTDARECTVGHLALEVGQDQWVMSTGRCDLRGVELWMSAIFRPTLAQDLALLGLARDLDAWRRGRIEPISTAELDRRVAGTERQLWSWPPLPNGFEQAEALLKTLKTWGVNTEDPIILAQVYGSIPDDDEDEDARYERRREEEWEEQRLETALEFDREFGTDTARLWRPILRRV